MPGSTGGASLRDRLIALRNQLDGVPVCLITHSHGGNVAFYAARDLPPDAVSAIANMATPYIRAERRNIGRYVRFLLWIAPLFIWYLLFGVMMIPWSAFLSWGGLEEWQVQSQSDSVYPALMAISAGFTYFITRPLRRWVLSWGLVVLEKKQAVIHERLQSDSPPGIPVLNMRITRDEPAIGLRIASMLANLPHLLWNPITILLLVLFAAAVTAFATASFSMSEPFFEHQSQATLGEAILVGFGLGLVLAVLLCAGAFLVALLLEPIAVVWSWLFRGAVTYGGRGFFENWLMKTKIVTTFPEVANFEDRRYDKPLGVGLRHSRLYDDDECIADMLDWLERQAAPGAEVRSPGSEEVGL